MRPILDPALLSAVIKAESDFDPSAVSRAGAIGLMQLMPRTAEKLDIEDPFDPDENIAEGRATFVTYLIGSTATCRSRSPLTTPGPPASSNTTRYRRFGRHAAM